MFTAKKLNFCKSEACPASHELLDFQNGDIELDRGSAICAHLAVCEFCSAEVEFYSHHPQANTDQDHELTATAIPTPLFQLAESILNNRRSDLTDLNRLLRESEEFALDRS